MRFLVNPIAGVRAASGSAIVEMMRGVDVEYDVVATDYKGHATVLAREAVEAGCDLVVAVGGDGTLNEVGKGLLGSTAAMGIIPSGSGNALARFLGIPRVAADACRILADADVRVLDVGRIEDQIFISSAGVGFDAEICRHFNARLGNRRGLGSYILSGLQSFGSYQPTDVRVVLEDGSSTQTRPTLLAFANTGHLGNGAVIAPQARPDDGVLDICSIEAGGLLASAWHTRRLFTGSIESMPGYTSYQAARFRVECTSPPLFQIDGEDIQAEVTSLNVSIEPGALRVAVPSSP